MQGADAVPNSVSPPGIGSALQVVLQVKYRAVQGRVFRDHIASTCDANPDARPLLRTLLPLTRFPSLQR